MRVVVVGATGNVGTSVVKALGQAREIESIVGVARRTPAHPAPKVEWRSADITTDPLDPLLDGADAVVHLAWAIQPSRDERALEAVNLGGTARLLEAVARQGIGRLAYASSVGAYAGVTGEDRDALVDESHPTTGIGTSVYSRHKAEVERMLDSFEAGPGADVAVARLRPALIFKREAAMEIRRLFAGPFFPNGLLRLGRPPVVPLPAGLRMQAVHADDVGRAFALAVGSGAVGAFNVAAGPVLDTEALARVVGGRAAPVPPRALRALATATWRLRLQPTPAGWLDMAMDAPLLDTSRARTELGWEPSVSSAEAIDELIDGFAAGAGGDTPPLSAHAGGRLRLGEVRSGVGARFWAPSQGPISSNV